MLASAGDQLDAHSVDAEPGLRLVEVFLGACLFELKAPSAMLLAQAQLSVRVASPTEDLSRNVLS